MRGGGDGLFWVERIGQPSLLCRSRHELRNALRTSPADGSRPEAAFLPDKPRQKGNR
jgi:hypothetical protein